MSATRLLALGITLTLTAAIATAQTTDDLPIERVVLFSSGVGYIQHAGSVQGDGSTTLHFTQAQLDDVLKSLVVEDRGGGIVEVVTFPSRAATGTSPRFRFDGSGTGITALLAQLTGAEIEVERPNGIFRGRLVGIDRVATGEADQVYISVLTNRGIEPIPFDGLTAIRATDVELQSEIARALAEVSEAHAAPGGDPLQVRFRGSGTRGVTLGYVVQQPLWKTSYRLALPRGDGRADLQGWAIVENHTDRDWNGISLSLVSGRPISFVTQLSRPIFVNRPRLDVRSEATSPVPVRYGAGIPAGMIRGTVMDAGTREPLSGAHVVVVGTDRSTVADRTGNFEIRNLPAGRHEVRVSFVGYSTQTQNIDVGRQGAALEFLLDPGMELDEVVVMGLATQRVRGVAGVAVTRSVEAVAEFGEFGEVFEYHIPNAHVPRGEAAMLPIVTGRAEIERVSLYQPFEDEVHPLRGVHLRNATGQHLQGGPASVFDDGAYVGDIYLPDLTPGARQFLSYAADLDLMVLEDLGMDSDDYLVTARIENGVLVTTHRATITSTYTVENRGDRRRVLIIEHPREADQLLSPQAEELTPGGYRLRMEIGPGRTETLHVREQETFDQRTAIIDPHRGGVRLVVNANRLPVDVRRAVARATELQRAYVAAQRARAEAESRLEDLRAEQSRARDNIQALPSNAPFVAELIARVEQLDRDITAERDQIVELREAEAQSGATLDAFVRNLNVGG